MTSPLHYRAHSSSLTRMADFGRTWWGRQWLAAFNGIDDLNRLPRGRRYANNGSVQSIDIGTQTVQARVQGSRRTPYKVTVGLTPFPKQQQQAILDAVEASPALLSRLLNRQLPQQLLALLHDHDIRLFPRSWKNMQAQCSCPDWAMPCKHIAAVLYMIANEVDKNPFVVFELHGMDLAGALQQRLGAQLGALTDVPALTAKWTTEPVVEDFATPAADAFADINLARVPALGSRIFTILSPNPLFHPKDFHNILAAQYKRTARAARTFDKTVATPWPQAQQLPNLCAVIDVSGHFAAINGGGKTLFKPGRKRRDPDQFEVFLQQLAGLPTSLESRLAHSLLLWRTLLRLALKLIEQRAYIPWVMAGDAGETLIQWRPALLSAPVRALFEQLCALCPFDLVILERQTNKRRTHHFADARTQIFAALHLLLAFFINRAYAKLAEAKTLDAIKALFFAGMPARFDRFETLEHPRLMRHWLRRLTLAERPHRLHLMVSERGETELAINLQIEHDGQFEAAGAWLAAMQQSARRIATLADLAVLADYFPAAERLYDPTIAAPELRYSLAAFTPVFRDILPALRMLGIGVILPKALHKLARPHISLALSASSDDEAAVSYLNLDELLAFDWQIAIGDQRVTRAEFRELIETGSGIVRFKNQYVMVDDADVEKVLDHLDKQPDTLSRTDLLQAGLGGELAGAKVTLNDRARELFDQLLHPRQPPTLPAGLDAELRGYQQRGFEWLAQNARLGFGSLLADDMGLGKTLQAIAVLLHLKTTGQLDNARSLVVVPTSLLTNWRREIERFAPTLDTHIFHGTGRTLPDNGHDVILTSYGLARSDNKRLSQQHWRALVIDEAQNIKNPTAAQTKAIKLLPADMRIAMSGTPVENRLREYWSVFDFINPGYLRTQKRFAEDFAQPIERDRDQAALDAFRRITAPFILRRLKTDKTIIADLPDKLEANRYCTLTPEQASLYQNSVDTILAELADKDEGIERRGLIFKLLNALKQICNSPAQFLDQDTARVAESGKLASFLELMHEAEAADEKAIIFTQYRTMGELLARTLQDEMAMTVPFLHGGLSRKQRDEMVTTFQNDRSVRAMILSLKAGGTGLNLTAASQVIHYDLWWNPAVEQQATDRAYRIGQQRNVIVHRLITEHTFEEKIDAMIQAKKELAELTVASGEQWISNLSNDELRDLVRL